MPLVAVIGECWPSLLPRSYVDYEYVYPSRPEAISVNASFAMFVNIPLFKDGVRQL
jgi:hypothetical protein